MFRKLFGRTRDSEKKQNHDAIRLGIDPEMNYCPTCGDEYRADMKRCAGCGDELVSGAEKLEHLLVKEHAFNARSMKISGSDQLVTVRTGKLRDLKPLQILLARDRIPALLAGEAGGCGKG
jgi:hypothetical protein